MKVSRYLILIPAALIIFAGCGSSDPDDHGRGDDAACVGGLATNNIASMDPKDGATGSDVASPIRITFACDIDETTINDSSLIVSWDDVVVEGTVTYEAATRTLIFTPKFPLYSGMTYDIKISGLLLTTEAPKSVAKIAGDVTKSFTAHMTPLIYSSTLDPADPATPTQRNIWTMNADGSGATRLTSYSNTSDSAHTTKNAWSPDDKYIAYVLSKNLSGTYYHFLMVMNADGSGQTTVAGDTGKFYWGGNKLINYLTVTTIYFDWAPDASKIYFIYKPDGAAKYDIYSARPDGTEKTKVTEIPAGDANNVYLIDGFRVSPDGLRLLYLLTHMDILNNTQTTATYLINSDGSGAEDISSAYFAKSPALGRFSADGKKIYAAGVATSGSIDMFEYDIASGNGWLNMTNLSVKQNVSSSDISMDGRYIVYSVQDSGLAAYTLRVLTLDSNTDYALSGITPAADPASIRMVAISPDSSKISYLYAQGGPDQPLDIYTITLSNSGNTRMTNGTAIFEYQALLWSPDSANIAYNVYVGAPKPAIYNIAIDTTPLTNSDAIQSRLEDWW